MDELPPLRTRVYIDGYNLYYGCLKSTSYKWLDIYSLFKQHILPSILVTDSQQRTRSIALRDDSAVRFFTAKISGSAAKSDDSVSSQARYHQALKNYYPEKVSIVEGYYSINTVFAPQASELEPERKPKDCPQTLIWKMEEKQSDVNLALHAYHDAIAGEIDLAVFVTNDTDLAPALKMIREHTSVLVGLVIPAGDCRRPNAELKRHAHWTRTHITTEELAASQLPRVILGTRKPTVKPESWYRYPDKLREVLELATPVLGGRSKVFKWLGQECSFLDNNCPIDLLETTDGAEKVLIYIRQQMKEVEKDQ